MTSCRRPFCLLRLLQVTWTDLKNDFQKFTLAKGFQKSREFLRSIVEAIAGSWNQQQQTKEEEFRYSTKLETFSTSSMTRHLTPNGSSKSILKDLYCTKKESLTLECGHSFISWMTPISSTFSCLKRATWGQRALSMMRATKISESIWPMSATKAKIKKILQSMRRAIPSVFKNSRIIWRMNTLTWMFRLKNIFGLEWGTSR